MLEKPVSYTIVTIALIAVIFTVWVKLGENPVTLVHQEVAKVGINAADTAMEMADDVVNSKAVRKSTRYVDKLFGTHVARHGAEWVREQTRAGHEETHAMAQEMNRSLQLKAFVWGLSWDNIIQKSPWQIIVGIILLGMFLQGLALCEIEACKSSTEILLGISAMIDARILMWFPEYANSEITLWVALLVPSIALMFLGVHGCSTHMFHIGPVKCSDRNVRSKRSDNKEPQTAPPPTCRICVTTIDEGDNYCGYNHCPSCKRAVKNPSTKFCGGCGTRVLENPLTCPTCNDRVDEEDNFCGSDHRLRAVPTATPSSPASTSAVTPPRRRRDPV